MIQKLDKILRTIVLITGALCIVFKLADSKKSAKNDGHEDFQTVEFDDIW